MGEVVNLAAKAVAVSDDAAARASFLDEGMWMVHMLRRVDDYSVSVWRQGPGCWMWDITLIAKHDQLAHSVRSFPNRRDAEADAWRGLRKLMASAAKGQGGSRSV
jgi:hypothetical protein